MAPRTEHGYDGDDERRRPPIHRAVKHKKPSISCHNTLQYLTETVTKMNTATETVYHTKHHTQTVISEKLIPETTILTEHWRTHFQDHWTTVTPPTVTQTVVATGYETTVTLPAHTEVSYHYIPCAEEITVIKHLGRVALLSWFLVLAWSIYAFRRRRDHRRRCDTQILRETNNDLHEA